MRSPALAPHASDQALLSNPQAERHELTIDALWLPGIGRCGADVTTIHPVSTRGLAGVEAIWLGQCDCGQTTFAASGKPEAVQAFFDALGSDTELTLGSQSRDGSRHEIS